jgi:hypothetical protein
MLGWGEDINFILFNVNNSDILKSDKSRRSVFKATKWARKPISEAQKPN